MPGHDVIVVGASAGGVEALGQLVRGLPTGLDAAVFVVLHVSPHGTSVLPRILSRSGPLPAAHAADGEPIRPGRIYVAPPDYHMLLKNGHVKLAHGPSENSHRPAVDPLFRTAARRYGRRVVGVVLSGVLDDGTAGLLAIKERGGIAVVQHPEDALYSGMPENALNHVAVDHAVPAAALGPLLARLAAEPLPPDDGDPPSHEMDMETDMAELELEALQDFDRPGQPSGFACPECGGALWELRDGELIRYRCRVGHAFSPDTLLAEQSDALEAALWSALRALEERAALAHRMAARADQRGHALIAEKFRVQVRECEAHAGLIRKIILGRAAVNTESAAPETGEKPEAGAPPPGG
jgi:two-component system, chemotaxis family, protein-glutamate methylesterase/glutaminase